MKRYNDDAVFISLNHTVVDLQLCFRTGVSSIESPMPYEGPVNDQNRPTTRPVCGSRPTSQNPTKQRRKVSIETHGGRSRDAPGLVPRPGMVCISPRRGYRKPAPAESLTERIGTTNPETKKKNSLN
jgi:hypothetical protein